MLRSFIAALLSCAAAFAQAPASDPIPADEPEAVRAFLARAASANPSTGPVSGRIAGDVEYSIFDQSIPSGSKRHVEYRYATEADWTIAARPAEGPQISVRGDRVVVLERASSSDGASRVALTFRLQEVGALRPEAKNAAPIDLSAAPIPANWIRWVRERYALDSVAEVRLLGLPKTMVSGKRRSDDRTLSPVVRVYFHTGSSALETIEFNDSETSVGAKSLRFEPGPSSASADAFAPVPEESDCSQMIVLQLRRMLPISPLDRDSTGRNTPRDGSEPVSHALPRGAEAIVGRMALRYAPVPPPASANEPCVHLVATGGAPLHPEGHLAPARCAECAAFRFQMEMAKTNPGLFDVTANRCPTGGVHQPERVACAHFGTSVAHPDGYPSTGPIPRIALLGPYFVGSDFAFSRWLDAIGELPKATADSALVQMLRFLSDVAGDERRRPAEAYSSIASIASYRDVVQRLVERLEAAGVDVAAYAEPLNGLVVDAVGSVGARPPRPWLQMIRTKDAAQYAALAERFMPAVLNTNRSEDAVAFIEMIDRIPTLPLSAALQLPEIEANAPTVEARTWAANRLNSRPAGPADGAVSSGGVWLGTATNSGRPVRVRLFVRSATDVSFRGEVNGGAGKPLEVVGSYDSSNGAVRVFVKQYGDDGSRTAGAGPEFWDLRLRGEIMSGQFVVVGRASGGMELARREGAADGSDVLDALRPGAVVGGEGSWKRHKGSTQASWRIKFTIVGRTDDQFTARAEFNGEVCDFRGTINARERSVEFLGRPAWRDDRGRRKESAMSVKLRAVGDTLCGTIKFNGPEGGEGPAELRVTAAGR
jgi:hypothetical protein